MRHSFTILAALFVLAAAASLFQPERFTLRSELPITLSKEDTRLIGRFTPTDSAERYIIEVSARGNGTVTVGDTPFPFGERQYACRPGGEDAITCRYVWSRPTPDSFDIYARASDTPTDITAIDVRRVYAKTLTPLVSEQSIHAGLLVLLAAPLIWLVHRWYAASQWVIVCVSVAGLSLIQPLFTLVLLGFLVVMFRAGIAMQARRDKRVYMVVVILAMTLAFLVLFKFGRAHASLVFSNVGGFHLFMPLGLSYFVIRLIDTQLKWYREQLKGFTFREYLCFMVFAPTIPAGPIETLDEFRAKRLVVIGRADIAYGLGRAVIGVAKKVFIADAVFLPLVTDNFAVVAADPLGGSWTSVIVLLLANFLFAYIDFSAYSDIAIGISRIFGYRIRENFNWPILQANLRAYWQSWHMSLSNWAMRNVFMPVAVATRNNYGPIFITMAAIGLWHSFGLPWFLWALHHGGGLGLLFWLESKRKLRGPALWWRYTWPLRVGATICFVALGHSFVLFDDVGTALAVYAHALSFGLISR